MSARFAKWKKTGCEATGLLGFVTKKGQVFGCVPYDSKALRRFTNPGRFIFSLSMVARPDGVSPTNSEKFPPQAKCAAQSSFLGWNSGQIMPVTGSAHEVWTCLEQLQPPQASARLSSSLVPPCKMEMICSMSKVSGEKSSGVWQYSQRWPARWAMCSRMEGENLRRCMAIFL